MPQTTIFQAPQPPSPPKPRLKLFRRAGKKQLPPLQLTPRDLSIIKAVYSFRALTSPQIETLLFPGNQDQVQATVKTPGSGKTNHCRHRLKLLYHHGYLQREELPTPLSYGRTVVRHVGVPHSYCRQTSFGVKSGQKTCSRQI